MTKYRTSAGSNREFYRIQGDLVVRVKNMEKMSKIDISDNWMVRVDAEDEFTKECTEQEFNTAYQEALQRIKDMKI